MNWFKSKITYKPELTTMECRLGDIQYGVVINAFIRNADGSVSEIPNSDLPKVVFDFTMAGITQNAAKEFEKLSAEYAAKLSQSVDNFNKLINETFKPDGSN